jgi:phage gp46-like protein
MDIALRNTNGIYDILIDNGDLLIEDTLETSITLSLLTDKRVTPEELPTNETSRRGFWGDLLGVSPQIGSKLWLLSREKAADHVRFDAEEYARESLEHLISDGFLEETKVSSSFKDGVLNLRINNQVFPITNDGA